MEGLFFIAMFSAIGACAAVAYDIIKPFSKREFDNLVKRNADFDAAMNFKADERNNDNVGVVLMRSDELDILP